MKLHYIERIGAAGTFITALACPACWPLFATLGSALGLGILLPWEGILMTYVFPALVVVSVIGSALSYRQHKKVIPTLIGIVSATLILIGFYFGWILTLMYIGIFGLLASALLSHRAHREHSKLCQ